MAKVLKVSYNYLKGLNGIRAIAAIGVVLGHIDNDMPYFNLPRIGKFELAAFGVTIFFSLSGFLITYLLLIEREQRPIAIKNFYMRRILRIWPLYYLYIALVLLLTSTGFTPSLLYYIFFVPNIPLVAGGVIFPLIHLWSLGVEEQFYAFWPLFIKNVDRIFIALCIFIGIFLLIKIFFHIYFGGWSKPYEHIYTDRFDCMAIGALGAWLFYVRHRIIYFFIKNISQVIAWSMIVLIAFNRFHFLSIVDHELVALITVVLILGQIVPEKPLINLENRVLHFIGAISFGIYVYHPLIITLVSEHASFLLAIPVVWRFICVYLLITGVTLLVSFLSYKYVEGYFLRLKGRYSPAPVSIVKK
jgi:peptidoglycan/LPS O-acetylase OafA/YrhL